jgi:GT2 family glycosyltransferase
VIHSDSAGIGIVVIGRNEGERLKRCLRSVVDSNSHIVYVDSGSSDSSIEFAQSLDIVVVNLDLSTPFTMARGRNAGFDYLIHKFPEIQLVQFIDGDCEVVPGYLAAAVRAIHELPNAVVVTGRRIERHPDASPYNRLCDLEWGRTLGEITACGGDMLVRSSAFVDAGKFNEVMIAGEEPELCVRLRLRGGKLYRIDQDMTLHDADIFRFGQWWKRAKRAGHAYAEGAVLQGHTPFRHNIRQVRGALFWGGLVPIIATACAILAIWFPWLGLITLLSMAAYVALGVRIYLKMLSGGWNRSDARLYAFSCVISKFPCCLGILHYWMHRALGKKSNLIEYKTPSPLAPLSHTVHTP